MPISGEIRRQAAPIAEDGLPEERMSERVPTISRSLILAAAGLLLPVIAGCAQQPVTSAVAIPPIPASQARIWVYRDYEPYAGRGLPAVAANGGYIGASQLGGAFYRDVTPGHYHMTVETWGIDTNQSSDVDLAAGQTAYIKIVSLPSWVAYGNLTTYERPTFYAWLIAPQIAQADIAHLAFYGGS
jgi:hypothetical protein